MKVFVEPTGRRIAPFDDPPGEALIGNRRLADRLDDAIREAGLTRIDRLEAPCLVVPDALWATGGALRKFVTGAAGRDAVLVLGDCRFARASTPVQPDVRRVDAGWRFDRIRYVADGAEPVEVVVDPEENPFDVPAPPYLAAEKMEFGLPLDVVMTLHHWVHILWANLFIGAVDMRRRSKWQLARQLGSAILRARSLNKWRVMGRFNIIGRNCDIHPTAVVEASTLGDNVKIGPFCRVFASTLGDGAEVWPYGMVELSTVGPRAVVTEQSALRFSVLYPEAVVGQYLMQMCVLGRKALTTGAAFSMDLNFDQNIRVPLDGKLHDTGTRFLGSAFGHRSRVGTGFWLASGRAIPNDYFVIRHPDAVVSRIPDGLAGRNPLAVQGQTLVPLG
ncbi:MAG: hypothetical protein H6703_09710 [Myxococcales bacterium]|nr:hypothetical protein [Myxococcales bacterium]